MIRSRTTQPRRSHSVNATLATVAMLLLALVVPAGAEPGNDNRAPDLGPYQDLKVEAGHKVAFHAYAAGVQIYRWNGAKWDFVEPEALLFANEDGTGVVGIHYGGPTWESNSGSTVVGMLEKRATADPDSIDWLRLKAKSSSGPGIFDGVTFIQRVNTVGGLAPTQPGDSVGEEARIPYTAEYFFYRAQH
jgi:hypothetical protein